MGDRQGFAAADQNGARAAHQILFGGDGHEHDDAPLFRAGLI